MKIDVLDSALLWPGVHYDDSFRAVSHVESARMLRSGMTLKYKQDQYFWCADGNWYRVVDAKWVHGLGCLYRFFRKDDLFVADFSLELLDEPPMSELSIKREFLRYAEFRPGKHVKAAKEEVRKCSTSLDYYNWLVRHSEKRWVY